MSKTNPFSIRVQPKTDHLIKSIARMQNRSRAAVAENLLEEAAQMHRFPGIGFRSGGSGRRRACLLGTRLDVAFIVELAHSSDGIDQLTENWPLSESQVKLALAYYEEFKDEIDDEISAQPSFEEISELYPGLSIDVVKATS